MGESYVKVLPSPNYLRQKVPTSHLYPLMFSGASDCRCKAIGKALQETLSDRDVNDKDVDHRDFSDSLFGCEVFPTFALWAQRLRLSTLTPCV